MKKIGLTGGIGAGKTFVAEVFQQLGIPVFNADVEAKKCMIENTALMESIKLIFGENSYINGVLQKDVLSTIVFQNVTALSKLNALVHPVVKQKFEDWCAEQTASIVIKEAAILFESDAHIGLDAIICVSAPENTRRKRVQKRDNITAEQVKMRMDKQMNQSEKENLSDSIIINDGIQLILPQIIAALTKMEQ